ncbi:MAG TPA: hypothetical protein VH743_18380 [Beijerinckiaceae bacterium]|jgi:hypothetical protein
MRNSPHFLASFTSLLLLAAALAACFLVVAFSWPQLGGHDRTAQVVSERCCDVIIGGPVIDGADVVPAEAQTASISAKR